ncbi:MAG: DUF2127 domain-containing protein [Pseudomonadota bacterium]
MSQQSGAGVISAIALFKLVKAVTLVAVGIGALSLVHRTDAFTVVRHSLREAGIDPNHRFVSEGIAKVSGLDNKRLEALSVGTFAYAAIFLVEGAGLLFRKHWAEFLTVFVTASFIPFELYELAHKPSVLKGVGLFVNVVIVVYLAVRLWREHKHAAPPRPAS